MRVVAEFDEAEAFVGVIIVKSTATVLPRHEDTRKSAGRSRELGSRCSLGCGDPGFGEKLSNSVAQHRMAS